MRLEEQYNQLIELKKTINAKLENLDFNRRKELLLWLAQDKAYTRLKKKDNQLLFLNFFSSIWLEEIKKNNEFQMKGDAFFGVSSLSDVEEKYHAGKFLALRIENDMPEELILEAVNEVIDWKYSGFALRMMISTETRDGVGNVIKLARFLMNANQAAKAIGLLECENEKCPGNDEIVLELASCWLEVQQYQKAYECLCLITNKAQHVNEMIQELEKLVRNDKL